GVGRPPAAGSAPARARAARARVAVPPVPDPAARVRVAHPRSPIPDPRCPLPDSRFPIPAMRLLSLEGKLAAALAAAVVAAGVLAAAATTWLESAWLGATAAVLVLALPALVFAHLLARPVAALIRALSGSVTAFRDGDFSFSIGARRGDEVGDLVDAHNELGRVLREQRQ